MVLLLLSVVGIVLCVMVMVIGYWCLWMKLCCRWC